jgi:hypothetical protein
VLVLGRGMNKKPLKIYIITLLWLALSGIFFIWGGYSLYDLVQIPSWTGLDELLPPFHFGYMLSTIAWLVFSVLFLIFAYETFRVRAWIWSAGIIITTIFLIVFGLMLITLMINAIMFLDFFSVTGLITVIISFIADLGIIFYLTRPGVKAYFESNILNPESK